MDHDRRERLKDGMKWRVPCQSNVQDSVPPLPRQGFNPWSGNQDAAGCTARPKKKIGMKWRHAEKQKTIKKSVSELEIPTHRMGLFKMHLFEK